MKIFRGEQGAFGLSEDGKQKQAQVQAGGQGGGHAHDQSEVNVFGIFPSSRILQSLDRAVGVLGSSLGEFLRRVFPKAYDPSSERKHEEDPKGGQNT